MVTAWGTGRPDYSQDVRRSVWTVRGPVQGTWFWNEQVEVSGLGAVVSDYIDVSEGYVVPITTAFLTVGADTLVEFRLLAYDTITKMDYIFAWKYGYQNIDMHITPGFRIGEGTVYSKIRFYIVNWDTAAKTVKFTVHGYSEKIGTEEPKIPDPYKMRWYSVPPNTDTSTIDTSEFSESKTIGITGSYGMYNRTGRVVSIVCQKK